MWNPKEILDSVGLDKREQKRCVRVADVIKNELSILLISKIRDPRLLSVSFTRVTVTDDLKSARVYFSVMGDKKMQKEALSALKKATGFMRSYLAKALNLRYTPKLLFFYDETVDKVQHLEELFREIEKERDENGRSS